MWSNNCDVKIFITKNLIINNLMTQHISHHAYVYRYTHMYICQQKCISILFYFIFIRKHDHYRKNTYFDDKVICHKKKKTKASFFYNLNFHFLCNAPMLSQNNSYEK